jgi:hypothetical protein
MERTYKAPAQAARCDHIGAEATCPGDDPGGPQELVHADV